MVKRLRDGTVDLKPNPASRWYDYQTYALQALAVLERMPEGNYLILNKSYREELAELFKALLALTRETHVKQLITPLLAAAAGSRPLKEKLYIKPNLTWSPWPPITFAALARINSSTTFSSDPLAPKRWRRCTG